MVHSFTKEQMDEWLQNYIDSPPYNQFFLGKLDMLLDIAYMMGYDSSNELYAQAERIRRDLFIKLDIL